MSSQKQTNGDAYPEAAGKHLADAKTLFAASRFDGSAYLSGYVVECALKTLLEIETGGAKYKHELPQLAADVSAVCLAAGTKTAKYVTATVNGVPSSKIANWHPAMRYQRPSVARAEALRWLDEAELIYQDTIGTMILDGVL